jgi:hypothetical protein
MQWAGGVLCHERRVALTRIHFVISNPDRALTVRSEALREDPETGFEEFLSLFALDLETAVPAYFRDRKLNSSFPDTPIPGGRDRPWDSWTDEQRATFDKVASSTVTQISEVAGGGSSP